MDKRSDDEILEVSYDNDADVLYISEGRPKEAISDMMENGVIVRKDPNTDKVIGITIMDFISHYSKSIPQPLPIKVDFQLVVA